MKTKNPSEQTIIQIRDLCKSLKIPSFFNALINQDANPAYAQMTFLRRLQELLQAEQESRADKRRARLFKQSGLEDPMATLDRLVYDSRRGLDRSLIDELATCRWITRDIPLNVVVTGMCGSGKTWLIRSLGRAATDLLIPVSFWHASDLIEKLENAHNEHKASQFRASVNSRPLVILDDFAMGTMSEDARDDFLLLLDDRAYKGSLVLASQRPFEEWYDYFGGAYHADALMDRLKNSSYHIRLKGRSFRELSESAQIVRPKHAASTASDAVED